MISLSISKKNNNIMLDLIHRILLGIHIPVGVASLILFWIPVGVKKGSSTHRKVGRYYYYAMWVVLITAGLMSIINLLHARLEAAVFLGYLTIITSYPLWYSYEILQQQQVWTKRYFLVRRAMTGLLFVSGIGMLLWGGIAFHFLGMGTTIGFFGLLALPAGRDVFMSKATAMNRENKLKMHIRGTIISGIAAYTAFFAFGGSRLFIEVLHMHHQWMVIPWTLPTILGVIYSRYMQKKYRVA